jgi:glycosyltransferase involved in cell wall biosynthesis
MLTSEKNTLVSIYIPCSNYGIYLEKAINSVISQSYDNWELFIYDDDSSDDSFDISKRYSAMHPSKIFCFQNESPIGLRNIANNVLKSCNGDYILRLDADDWLDENAILVLLNKSSTDVNAVLIYSAFFYVDSSENIIGYESQFSSSGSIKDINIPVHGACSLIKTNALKSIGGYNTNYTSQDGWELWFNLRKKGVFLGVETPLFYYRQHSESLSTNYNKLLESRSKIYSDLSIPSGDYKSKVVVFLPIGPDYKKFKNVPFQKIGEKYLLQHMLDEILINSNSYTTVVTTSDNTVYDFISKYKVSNCATNLFVKIRKPSLSSSLTPRLKLIEDAGDFYYEIFGDYPDAIITLNLHHPFMNYKNIALSYNILLTTLSDSVVSVYEEREPIFMRDLNGLKLLGSARINEIIQSNEQLFKFDGEVICTWWNIIKQGHIFGNKIGYIDNPCPSVRILSKHDLASLTKV